MEVPMEFWIATASPPPAVALVVLSALGLAGGAAALVGSIVELERLRPAWLRIASLLLSAAMILVTALDGAQPVSAIMSCIGFLVALQAIAIEFARLPSLHDYAADPSDSGEPLWWQDFEKEFWGAVSSNATHEPDGASDGDAERRE
jgi:hypothetical protein